MQFEHSIHFVRHLCTSLVGNVCSTNPAHNHWNDDILGFKLNHSTLDARCVYHSNELCFVGITNEITNAFFKGILSKFEPANTSEGFLMEKNIFL